MVAHVSNKSNTDTISASASAVYSQHAFTNNRFNSNEISASILVHPRIGIIYSVLKTDQVGDPSFSPDGQTVIFVESIRSTNKISTIGLDGTPRGVLYTSQLPLADPYYSEDGYFVAFAEQTAPIDGTFIYGKWRLKYMNADGTGVVTILDDGNANMHPFWTTPNQIAFQSWDYTPATVTYQGTVLDDDPLVYFRLGEVSGTTVTDSSGNGYTGTYYGSPTLGVTSLVTSSADKAVTFTGTTGQRAQTNAPVAAAGTIPTFAVEAFYSFAGDGDIAVLGEETFTDYINLYYASGNLTFDFIGTGGTANCTYPVSSGTAHHIVGEYNGTQLKLYLDGVIVDTTAFIDDGALQTVNNYLGAGCWPSTTGLSAIGTVDEVAFYTHAIGPTRVAAHYAAAIGSPDQTFNISMISLSGGGRIDMGEGEYPRVMSI